MRPGSILSLALLVTGLIASGAAPGSNPVEAPPSCAAPGFTLRRGQEVASGGVWLYTLPTNVKEYVFGPEDKFKMPTPYASWQATAAACAAHPSCAMFTSDGYLIAAVRTGDADSIRLDSEGDMFEWSPMRYCAGPCCGTWVAHGLLEVMREPVTKEDKYTRQVDWGAVPSDGPSSGTLKPISEQPVCAQKPGSVSSGSPKMQCPQRCIVACCAQLRAGNGAMGMHYFSQCSLRSCFLPDGASVTVPPICRFNVAQYASNPIGKVLLRQFTRAQATQGLEAAAASKPAGKAKDCPPSGGAAKQQSGTLC